MNRKRQSGPTKTKLPIQPGDPLSIKWAKSTQFKIPIPKDETQRLAALRRYKILDTPPEEAFDDITLLASHACQTPVALVVLLDSLRQWFKAKIGIKLAETPRELSFCAYTIMQRDLLIIPDARADRRFATNPLVNSGPKFRFYAGAPLITSDNRAIGTLCVLDHVPRQLTFEQGHDLIALSRLVMCQLELRRRNLSNRRQVKKTPNTGR